MGKDKGGEEALKWLEKRGFPHARRQSYVAQTPKAAHPEVKEPEDKLTLRGEAIGRHNRGRGGLEAVCIGRGGAEKDGAGKRPHAHARPT